MSEHIAKIEWHKEGEFSHLGFNRIHEAEFYPNSRIKMAGASNGEHADPEQMLAASLASCHMQTFLALAAKKRLIITSYTDTATAILDQNSDGLFYVSKITLAPNVTFSEEMNVTAKVIESMHEKSHKHCFVANSLKCDVDILPR